MAPRFKPDTLVLEDETKRALTQHRIRQWLEDERSRYLADPDAPLAPGKSRPNTLQPDVDAVVQVYREAGYDDFGFVMVRSDYSDEDAWTRWNTAFQEYLDQRLEKSQGGQSIADK